MKYVAMIIIARRIVRREPRARIVTPEAPVNIVKKVVTTTAAETTAPETTVADTTAAE